MKKLVIILILLSSLVVFTESKGETLKIQWILVNESIYRQMHPVMYDSTVYAHDDMAAIDTITIGDDSIFDHGSLKTYPQQEEKNRDDRQNIRNEIDRLINIATTINIIAGVLIIILIISMFIGTILSVIEDSKQENKEDK